MNLGIVLFLFCFGDIHIVPQGKFPACGVAQWTTQAGEGPDVRFHGWNPERLEMWCGAVGRNSDPRDPRQRTDFPPLQSARFCHVPTQDQRCIRNWSIWGFFLPEDYLQRLGVGAPWGRAPESRACRREGKRQGTRPHREDSKNSLVPPVTASYCANPNGGMASGSSFYQ